MVNVNSDVTDQFYRYKMPKIIAKVRFSNLLTIWAFLYIFSPFFASFELNNSRNRWSYFCKLFVCIDNPFLVEKFDIFSKIINGKKMKLHVKY